MSWLPDPDSAGKAAEDRQRAQEGLQLDQGARE